MPKYVLKEDVEKGLVDPSKALDEQPAYKEKIDKEAAEKQKKHETKQRPKKERPPRNPRPEFNWNKKQVTLQTKPPAQPKKLLEKPDQKKYRDGLDKLKQEREDIKGERWGLIEEQKRAIRYTNEAERSGKQVRSQFSGELGNKFEVQKQMRKQIRALDDAKNKIKKELQDLETKIETLKRPRDPQLFSAELLADRIREKEHILNTAGKLDKHDEHKLNKQINELKRAVPKARGRIEIEAELGKVEDQANILDRQLRAIKYELHLKITESNGLQEQIDGIKKQKESELGKTEDHKSVEDIRKEYDVKLKKVEEKRDKLEERIEDYTYKHQKEQDAYEDQQDLLRYIDWVNRQIQYLKDKQDEEERRKKEQEAYEKKKQKEYEERQKKREQRRKEEQERKLQQEARKQQLERQKEAFLNRNPNHREIDFCHELIAYCERLKPSAFKREQKRVVQPTQVKLGKDWQKEVKGGAEVIVSKKTKVEEDVVKKQKQPKKQKDEKAEDESFSHDISITGQFQSLNLLPPNTQADLDNTIQLIRDKLAVFNNPTEEEKAAFKEQALAQWEKDHAPRERERRDHHHNQTKYKQKDEKANGNEREEEPVEKRPKAEKYRGREKKEITAGDFPELA